MATIEIAESESRNNDGEGDVQSRDQISPPIAITAGLLSRIRMVWKVK